MKRIRLFITLLAVLTALTASAGLNLKFNISTARGMNIILSPGTDEYTLVTLNSDPYISFNALTRDLDPEEVYLTFEYISDKGTNFTQLFYGSPATEARSKFYSGLAQAPTWTQARFKISDERSEFDWGAKSEVLRIDFGSIANVNMRIRHIRINRLVNDPWVSDPTLFSNLETIKELGLPVIEVQTVGNELPTAEYVAPPAGSIGATLRNATKVPGSVRVHLPDGSIGYDSGDYVKGESGMTIKLRGNTSAFTPKKPYKIKLQKKGDLLCRGDKKFNDKNWVLLKDEDCRMRNGLLLDKLLGGCPWTPSYRYVNLILNGEYMGHYLLVESVERNTDCRINVKKTGYILELDPYWWNEDGHVVSHRNPVHNYTFKYPDYADLTSQQLVDLWMYLWNYESAVMNGKYADVIDVPSFARWMLGHDILGTLDAGGSNMFYTIDDFTPDAKIAMANMWDFDTTEQCPDDWSYIHTYHFSNFFNPNLSNVFITEYCRKWNEIYPRVFNEMVDSLNAFAVSDEGRAFDRSAVHDAVVWGKNALSASANSERAIDWFKKRKNFLLTKIMPLKAYSGVENVTTDSAADPDAPADVYNLQGRCVRRAATPADLRDLPPGLYIYKGHKCLITNYE